MKTSTFEEVLAAAGLDELTRDLTAAGFISSKSYVREKLTTFARFLLSQYEEATRVEKKIGGPVTRRQGRKSSRQLQAEQWNAALEAREEKIKQFYQEK
jgi:hypothetical protein